MAGLTQAEYDRYLNSQQQVKEDAKEMSELQVSKEHDSQDVLVEEQDGEEVANLRFVQEKILPYFSDSQHNIVTLVLKFIGNNNKSGEHLTIAPDLTLVFNGDPIKGSNIIDILKKLVAHIPVQCMKANSDESLCRKYVEKLAKIPGLQEVCTKLALNNFPDTMIPNSLLALGVRQIKS